MKKNRIRQALLICFSTLYLAACGAKQEIAPERSNTEYIFVHGLSGWGSYDKTYQRMPYWGMLGGDLMKYLRSQGFPVMPLQSPRKAVPGTGPVSFMPS